MRRAKTPEERLRAAALVLRRLERAGLSGRGSEILDGVVEDLGLRLADVERYALENREKLDELLAAGKSS